MSGAGAGITIMSEVYQRALGDMANAANEKALNRMVTRELNRQGLWAGQNNALSQQNVMAAGAEGQQAAQQKGARGRSQAYAGAAAQPMFSKNSQVAPNFNMDLRTHIMNNLLRSSQAQLGGRQDAAVGQQVRNSAINDAIGTNNNFSTASANIAPMEMANSQTAGDKYRMWASVVKTLGNLGGSMNIGG